MRNAVNTTNVTINATTKENDMTKLTMVQLKDLAKAMGLKGYSSIKKGELIKLIASTKEQEQATKQEQVVSEQTDITILSLDELYNSDVAGREKQAELARRADIKFPEKDHSSWSIQWLYNLLKADETRAARRAEFRSAFRKDENGWFVATGKDGTRYAFDETKAIVKVGDEPAKMKEVSSLQEGFDVCWEKCCSIYKESLKEYKKAKKEYWKKKRWHTNKMMYRYGFSK